MGYVGKSVGYVGKSVGYVGKSVGYAAITHTFQPMKSIRSDVPWYKYIYVGMYVCRGPKNVGGITWAKRAHAQSQYWAVKSDQ